MKKLWSYIKENSLQDPKNKQNIICDESLRALFHVDRINMFQMNKALAKHIWPLNVDNGISLNKALIFYLEDNLSIVPLCVFAIFVEQLLLFFILTTSQMG